MTPKVVVLSLILLLGAVASPPCTGYVNPYRSVASSVASFSTPPDAATTSVEGEGGSFPASPGVEVNRSPDRAEADRAASQRLSSKDKREVFEKTWRQIRDHYYDPALNGVNWSEVHVRYAPLVEAAASDADFYALMSQMTGELHDAHTRFSSPSRWKSYKKQLGTTIGFTVDDVDGKTVITSVEPGSHAARAGIEPGMSILTIDDQPIEARIGAIEKTRLPSSSERATRWFTYSRLFAGPPNKEVKLGLQRADGSSFQVVVVEQVYSEVPAVFARSLPSGNVYIRFDGFERPIVKQLKEALEKFRNAPGIIIDLRKNGGGDLSALIPIAGFFFNAKTLFARDTTRSGRPLSGFAGLFRLPLNVYAGKTGHQVYGGPVIVLVDAHSASSAEVFAAGMQDTRRAKIIGTQSCGCVLGIAKAREMKGGGVLEISEVLWLTLNGRKLEGTGIIPDENVAPNLSDLRRKHDAVLAKADQALAARVALNFTR
jgi:carboxyl-terminal processing protease